MNFFKIVFLVLWLLISNSGFGQMADTTYTLSCTNQDLDLLRDTIDLLKVRYKVDGDSVTVNIEFIGSQKMLLKKNELYLINKNQTIPLINDSIDRKGFYAPVHKFFNFHEKTLSLFHLPLSGIGIYVSDMEITETVRANSLFRKIMYVEFNSSGYITGLALRSTYATFYYTEKK